MNIKIISLILLTVFFAGCASNSPKRIYYWDGSYTKSVYDYMSETGDINLQINSLENLIQKSYEHNQKVAPGVFAHLGLLYSNIGNNVKANNCFDKEIENFPESKAYMVFLRQQKPKSKKGGK